MRTQFFFGILLSSVLSGCALFSIHSKSDPEGVSSTTAGWKADRLLHLTCEAGKGVSQVNGTVWLKTLSKEVQGQFNASVMAWAPDRLKLEVSNFIGGPIALISVHKRHYEIVRGSGEPMGAEDVDSWGGIPLRWAADLFLGRIPCPTSLEHLVVFKDEASELNVEDRNDALGTQNFIFKYKRLEDGSPWPESLHWERGAPFEARVDFKFDKPEQGTLSPLQWEATSKDGVIKVRWKDRRRDSVNEGSH